MKVYLDTNIVIADAIKDHVHHANAAGLFRQIELRKWTPVISAHGLAEVYSVLTRAPFTPRIAPMEAWRILAENVLAAFEVVALSRTEYGNAIQECAAQGWSGGRVHDALHIATARKARCERIYTFDVVHYRQLAPDLLDNILMP